MCVSLDSYPTAGFAVAGAGMYLPAPELALQGATWEVAEEYGDAKVDGCRAFMPVPGPLQTVQLAEFWVLFLALQAFWPGHLGIDNLNVVLSIARLFDHGCFSKPLLVVKDGDLVAIVQHMILAGEPETVKVTKVKDHATETDVEQGRGRRTGLGTLRLNLLLTWVGGISQRRLCISGGP